MRRTPFAVGLVLAGLIAVAPGSTGSSAGATPATAPSAVAARAQEGPATKAAPATPLKPKKGRYKAKITRTKHGIPHIKAKDWGSLGFGSGYATAETSICTLADVLITGRGQRSRFLGAEGTYNDQVSMKGSNLQVDALVTDLHGRRVVERLLQSQAGPGEEARAVITGFAAGANKWIRTHKVKDPGCKNAAWIKPDATPLDMWYGIYTANILASTGHFLPQITEAKPPTLPTDNLPQVPGLPALPLRTKKAPTEPSFAPVPPVLPSKESLLKGLGKDPDSPFGSNATAVGRDITSTGRGMVLGNPHFPWTGRYRFGQQQLTIPGAYNVAGASLIGSPVVNIGWNKHVAWSHTVSTAYRFTPYEYKLIPGMPTSYLTTRGLGEIEKRTVQVKVRKADGSLDTVTRNLYRTPQGYVINNPEQLMGWTTVSAFALRDANGEQLRTIDSFLDMGKARNVHDLLAKQDAGGGIPWVNTIAADRNGEVLYADHSVVPNVSNAMAATCMTPIGLVLNQVAGLPGLDGTRADADCAWGNDADAQRPGIFGPANLPAAFRTDWVMNANDSYWLPNPAQPLTGFSRIIGCEECVRTMRTRMVDRYVMDRIASGAKVTPESLRGTEHENRVMAGEVIGTGTLVALCESVNGGDACPALAGWDLHSNTSSRGYGLFEEFVTRLPAGGGLLPSPSIWKVPFSKDDPVNTPRDLDIANASVKQAMTDAIAALRAKGIPMDAPWGFLQVAGDRGAPAIGLGGGNGDQAGNANALASRDPKANLDHLRPISYGSSHIQAIAFIGKKKVNARTILTYGQSENPKSKWSRDQTRMFANKKWVKFDFTAKQIRRHAVSVETVTGKS